jgi:hypothetical protein
MIPVKFCIMQEDDADDFLKSVKNNMPWLKYLVENATHIRTTCCDDACTMTTVVQYEFELPEHLETFYLLKYR